VEGLPKEKDWQKEIKGLVETIPQSAKLTAPFTQGSQLRPNQPTFNLMACRGGVAPPANVRQSLSQQS